MLAGNIAALIRLHEGVHHEQVCIADQSEEMCDLMRDLSLGQYLMRHFYLRLARHVFRIVVMFGDSLVEYLPVILEAVPENIRLSSMLVTLVRKQLLIPSDFFQD